MPAAPVRFDPLHDLRARYERRIQRNPAARRAFQSTSLPPLLAEPQARVPVTSLIKWWPLERGGADDPGNVPRQTKEAAREQDRIESLPFKRPFEHTIPDLLGSKKIDLSTGGRTMMTVQIGMPTAMVAVLGRPSMCYKEERCLYG